MKLIQSITKPVSEMFADQGSGHSEVESTKRKFIAIIKGDDGNEVEKKCKAYSINDIKHHFGDKFVDAELHPDEKRFASDDDEEADDRTSDEMDADAEPTRPTKHRASDVKEAKINQFGTFMGFCEKHGVDEDDVEDVIDNAYNQDTSEYVLAAEVKRAIGKRADLKDPKSKAKALAAIKSLAKFSVTGKGPAAKRALSLVDKFAEAAYKHLTKHWNILNEEGALGSRLTEMGGGPGFYIVGGRPGEWEVVDGPFADKEETAPALRKHNGSGEDFTARFFKQRPKQITEMAKRTSPAEFYKLCVAKHGVRNAGYMSWAMIKGVADEADILIPAYIRDNKIGRGVWDAKPKDMLATAHEPTIAKTEEPRAASKAPSKDAIDRAVSRMVADVMAKTIPARKEEPKRAEEPKGAPVPEKKEHYEKHDFDTEFAWTTTYSEPRDLYAAIKQHHGVEHADTERIQVGKSTTGRFGVVLATYYIVKRGTMDVLGQWTVTGGDKIPGRGFVSYGSGNIALSKKAIKNRDDNRYGFLIKPEHGSPFISVGTQHSHGPWDEFSAKANVQDKYQHYEYDDEFGHGTISVVKVVKKNGKWERA